MARAANPAARRAETALPPRSLVAAITGAAAGTIVPPARSAPKACCRSTRTRRPASCTRGPALHRVDVDERHHVRPGQQPRHDTGEAGQDPGGDRVELAHMPERERAQERADRRRARTPVRTLAMPPWRSTSRSSIESAPATIPATTHPAFTAALTPHLPPGRTCSAASSPSPARCASAITGTSPACDTRFGSSKDACVLARAVQQSHLTRCPLELGDGSVSILPSSQLRGHLSRCRAPEGPQFARWIVDPRDARRSGIKVRQSRVIRARPGGQVSGVAALLSRVKERFRPA